MLIAGMGHRFYWLLQQFIIHNEQQDLSCQVFIQQTMKMVHGLLNLRSISSHRIRWGLEALLDTFRQHNIFYLLINNQMHYKRYVATWGKLLIKSAKLMFVPALSHYLVNFSLWNLCHPAQSKRRQQALRFLNWLNCSHKYLFSKLVKWTHKTNKKRVQSYEELSSH